MTKLASRAPLIVGIGGATRAGGASELLVRAVLAEAETLGARTQMISGPELMFPIYTPKQGAREERAQAMIEAVQACDGLIIASPGYHGSMSGLIKNALDYVEDLRGDSRPYLDGRAVGCIACAAGWQTTGAVLAALRSVVHALRGWPTPLGIAANSLNGLFDEKGACVDAALSAQIAIMAEQIVGFASTYGASAHATHQQKNASHRDIIYPPHDSFMDAWL